MIMIKITLIRIFFTLTILGLINSINAQENNDLSLTYGVGYGYMNLNDQIGGKGSHLAIGLNYKVLHERVSISHNLQFGAYSSGRNLSLRDEYFNDIHLDLLLHYSIIRYKSLSLNIISGGLIGTSRGLAGTGTEWNRVIYADEMFTSSRFFNQNNFGLKGAGSISYKPKNGRVSVEFIPLTLMMGKSFSGAHTGLKVRLDISRS
jgi:hypothetical protein